MESSVNLPENNSALYSSLKLDLDPERLDSGLPYTTHIRKCAYKDQLLQFRFLNLLHIKEVH